MHIYVTLKFTIVADVEVRICVRNEKEFNKCEWLKAEVDVKNYPTRIVTGAVNKVACVRARDNAECLVKIEAGEADIVNLDAGSAYTASIKFVSALISAESYSNKGKFIGELI